MSQELRTDEQLVSAYLSGENTAFDQLVPRYQDRLVRFAAEITKDYQEGEDAVQETWLHVWQNIRQFEPTRKFSSWLYKICRNEALKKVREKHREFQPLPEDIENLRPGRFTEWAEDKAARDRILAVLSGREHRLYNLVIREGYPFEAIPMVEPLFEDLTWEQLRDEFAQVMDKVYAQAEKEKEKWRGKKP